MSSPRDASFRCHLLSLGLSDDQINVIREDEVITDFVMLKNTFDVDCEKDGNAFIEALQLPQHEDWSRLLKFVVELKPKMEPDEFLGQDLLDLHSKYLRDPSAHGLVHD